MKLHLSPDACPPLGALSSFAGLLRPGAGQVRAVLLRHWLAGATDAGHIAASEALPTGGGALRWRGGGRGEERHAGKQLVRFIECAVGIVLVVLGGCAHDPIERLW